MNWSDFLLADHEAGTLIWKENVDIPTGRIRNMRNTRFAGKIAGNVGVNGYREVRLLGRLHKAHRILWEMAHGPIPKGYGIDHIDGNPGNNRLLNLRLANQSENNRNNYQIRSLRKLKAFLMLTRKLKTSKIQRLEMPQWPDLKIIFQ